MINRFSVIRRPKRGYVTIEPEGDERGYAYCFDDSLILEDGKEVGSVSSSLATLIDAEYESFCASGPCWGSYPVSTKKQTPLCYILYGLYHNVDVAEAKAAGVRLWNTEPIKDIGMTETERYIFDNYTVYDMRCDNIDEMGNLRNTKPIKSPGMTEADQYIFDNYTVYDMRCDNIRSTGL